MKKIWFVLSLLLSGTAFGSQSVDLKELRELARKGKDKSIIKLYKKNPSGFDSIHSLNVLARSHYKLGELRSTVITCAKSMKLKIERGTNPCGKLLAQIRKKHPQKYELYLAEYFTGEHEFKSALVKYYRLLQQTQNPDDARRGLISLFQLLKQPDYVKEQWEMLGNPKQDSDTQKWIQTQSAQFTRSYGRLAMEKLPHHDYRIYNMLVLSGTSKGPYFRALVNHYEGVLRSGYSAKIALRLANLYLLAGDLERSKDVLGEMDFRLDELGDRYTISDRLSRESLLSRLPESRPLPGTGGKEQATVISRVSQPIAKESDGEKAFVPPRLSKDPGAAYEPFDFTHLEFATNDDLSSFSDLRSEFEARFEKAQDPYQKRWVFEQVNNRLSMLYLHRVYTHNEDPRTIPIGKYFLSGEGKAFREQLDSLENSYKEQDKENAKQFEGTVKRLEKELSKSPSLQERSEVLRRFYVWWDTLLYREKDLFKKGAFAAYLDTKEGVLLMKKARRAATRVNDATLY